MELHKKQIPDNFKKSIPPGFKFATKGDHEFLVVESIFCRNGHHLLDDAVHMHGEPSLKLTVKIGAIKGIMFVDSFWGSHAKLFSFFPGVIEDHALVEAFCPHCTEKMMSPYDCDIDGCGSDTGILFHLPGEGNLIYVCARLGCPGHQLRVANISNDLTRSISQINYFGAGAEDLFGDF